MMDKVISPFGTLLCLRLKNEPIPNSCDLVSVYLNSRIKTCLQCKVCTCRNSPKNLTLYHFLVHLSWRLKCTIVITRCPSSVRPSSVRPSVVLPSLTFHIFDFSSETTEQNSTKLDGKQELNILYQVCVLRADRKNKMAALASDWLRHFRFLLWNRWTEFKETWQEARS